MLKNHCLLFAYRGRRASPSILAACLLATAGQAAELETASDLKVRWDNTVKYSAAYRTGDPSPQTTGVLNPNGDDGNLNFRHGLVSSRVDLLSELDVSFKSLGARVSGAAWYDGFYRRANRNNSPATANSVPANEFAPGTASLLGRRAEILDAFVFGQADLGDSRLASFRLGRHALLFGESVYFGSNAVAGTQGPVDSIKALQVPSSQVKEIIRPVNQLSGQMQVRPDLSVGGYYQLEWRKNRLPAAGSFLSSGDFLDDGGAQFLLGAPLIAGGGRQFLQRSADVEASNSGQFGAQLRWQPSAIDAEFGFYATRSNSKSPIVHVRPAVIAGIGVVDPASFNPVSGQVGTYSLVYPESIQTVGASFSTTSDALNVAGEASLRRNMPLMTAAVPVLPGQSATNQGDVLYAVGRSAHMQVSAIYALSRTAWWQGGSLSAELAWNRRLDVTRNPQMVDPNSTRDASAVRLGIEPVYYQVWSGVDLTIPISIGYGISGRSSVIPNFSVEHGGDVTVGISAEYQKQWKLGLNYVSFTGGPRPLTSKANSPSGMAYTYGQTLADRGFIAFSAQRTF